MTARPLLFLDVDGPLNPYDAKPHRRPAGYLTHRMRPTGWQDPWQKPLRVWLNPAHGSYLIALPYDLVWATTWGTEANEWIDQQATDLTNTPTIKDQPMTDQPTTPAVGDQIVVLYGPPWEMTWDDSGANDIGETGVLTEILGPGWLAPFVVTTADGRTIYASKIRAA